MVDLYNTVRNTPEYFKPIYCGELLFTRYDCPQTERFQDLYCEHNQIVYVISGKRVFYLPGETIDMTEGKCILSRKGAWIAEKEPGQGWCVLVFFIPDDFLRDFFKENRTLLPKKAKGASPAPQIFNLHVNEITKGFFHSMIPYFGQVPPAPEKLVEMKFRELLLNLFINERNTAAVDWLGELSDSSRVSLQRIMDANFTFNLSLDEFARIAGRSLATFKREFKEVYHTTPGKWLMAKRLGFAGLLLDTTQKNINEIAWESGFENAAHFSKQFKEKFGVPPSEYRLAERRAT